MTNEKLTRSERITLTALRACGGEALGLEIVQAGGGLIPRTSVYIVLSHLQRRGFVTSRYVRAGGLDDQIAGGQRLHNEDDFWQRRRIYSITPEVTAAFEAEVPMANNYRAAPQIIQDAIVEALELYAEPESYHVLAFPEDAPGGLLGGDFDAEHGDTFYDREMPGKKARAALAMYDKWLADPQCPQCELEAELGTEEVPHPIDPRVHTCQLQKAGV